MIQFILLVVVLAVCSAVGALLWPYTLNSWLVFFDCAPVVTPLHGALLGICPVIGQTTIPVAVITWIAMLFLGG